MLKITHLFALCLLFTLTACGGDSGSSSTTSSTEIEANGGAGSETDKGDSGGTDADGTDTDGTDTDGTDTVGTDTDGTDTDGTDTDGTDTDGTDTDGTDTDGTDTDGTDTDGTDTDGIDTDGTDTDGTDTDGTDTDGTDTDENGFTSEELAACNPDLTVAKTLIALINESRSKNQMCGSESYPAIKNGNVQWNVNLCVAAYRHSKDMATNNFFNHTSQTTGSNPGVRVKEANYKYWTVGENIAAGTVLNQAVDVHAGWMKSPGHCKTIMGSYFKEVGVAMFEVSPGTSKFNYYWTEVFGTR